MTDRFIRTAVMLLLGAGVFLGSSHLGDLTCGLQAGAQENTTETDDDSYAPNEFEALVHAGEGDNEERGIPIRFSLKRPAYLTLVIEDEAGQRVRNLVADTRFEAGEHTVYWDGYDEGEKQGEEEDFDVHRSRVEPGEYKVRGLMHDGLALEYQVSVQSPGEPPWHTPDRSGAWLADHTPPADVVFLPNGSPHGEEPQMMISAPTGETGHSVIWTDLEGNKLWGGKVRGWRSGQIMAVDEGANAAEEYYAYAVVEDEHFYGKRRDLESEPEMYDHLLEFDPPEIPDDVEEPNWREALARRDMAIRDGAALISYTQADTLAVLDIKENRQLDNIEIASPRGLAYDAEGRLHMVSDGRVLRFDDPAPLEGDLGEPEVVIGDGVFEDAGRLMIDGDGRLFLAVLGDRHQIEVFDAEGNPIRTIGEPGGVELGWYDERRMALPAGMALDGQDRLWVAEAEYAPKRVSRWDAESGAFDRAWYGPPKYGGGGRIDPRDPTRFYYSSGLQGMEFKLDWENDRNMPPRSIYWHTGHNFGRCPDATVYVNDRQYMVNSFFGPSYFTANTADVYIYNEDSGVAEHVAHVGTPPSPEAPGDPDQMPEHYLGVRLADHPELSAKLEEELYTGHFKSRFIIWSDLNRDGIPQPEEIQAANFGMEPVRRDFGGVTFDRDLAIATTAGIHVPAPTFNEEGTPVWDLEARQPFAGGHTEHLSDVVQAEDDTFIFTMGGYNAPRVTRAYDGDQLVWRINGWGGAGAPDPIAEHPGQLINAQRNIGFPFTPAEGEGGEMFILNGWHGSLYVLTTDGLIVTDLGGDSRTHPRLSQYPEAKPGLIVRDTTFHSEHFWPAVVQMEDERLYVSAGKEFSSVFDVVGCESIRRLGPWTIDVAQDQLAELDNTKIVPGEGRTVERSATLALSEQAPAVDGDLSEWAGAEWLSVDGRRGMEGAVTVHGDTLYAAWRTEDPELLNNDAGDGWQYVFATGGGLDLMLRADADNDSDSPAPGDQRLFVTRLDDPAGGPVLAVRFQQEGGAEWGEPVTYASPVGEAHFDSVEDVSDQVRLAQQDGNYELAAPLETLGLDVHEGMTTRGDIGVLLGDGSDTHARLYWSNRAAQITTDIPSEARLQPEHWGEWRFE